MLCILNEPAGRRTFLELIYINLEVVAITRQVVLQCGERRGVHVELLHHGRLAEQDCLSVSHGRLLEGAEVVNRRLRLRNNVVDEREMELENVADVILQGFLFRGGFRACELSEALNEVG